MWTHIALANLYLPSWDDPINDCLTVIGNVSQKILQAKFNVGAIIFTNQLWMMRCNIAFHRESREDYLLPLVGLLKIRARAQR